MPSLRDRSSVWSRRGARALAAGLLVCAAASRADTVLVAVAANFAQPLARLAPDFTQRTGHQVRITSGSTGRLHAQIEAGAPFEVLLAADERTPRLLEAGERAVAGTRFTYAFGRLVLWSADPARVDARGEVLARGGFDRLAIANPELAPYGRAAMQVLAARGLDGVLAPRLVRGTSVAQAYQFAATGNASLAFIAGSQWVDAAGRGSAWPVPAELHDPIRQDAVLLAPGRDRPAARALLAYLRSAPAQALIEAAGYATAP